MTSPRSGPAGVDGDGRSDADLLAAARSDPGAFGTFYARNVKALLTFFWFRTLDPDLASDLTAETFAAALANLERFDSARGSPQQWLYGIANNQLKRMWRWNRVSSAARRRLRVQTPPTAAAGWEEIEAADARLDADRLARALDRVAPRSREAVRLRLIERLDYTDIAHQMGCKPGSARSLVMRGLRRLREEFDAPPSQGNRP